MAKTILTIDKNGQQLVHLDYLEKRGYERAYGQMDFDRIAYLKRGCLDCIIELIEYRHGGPYDRARTFEVKAHFRCSRGFRKERIQINFYGLSVERLMTELPDIELKIYE